MAINTFGNLTVVGSANVTGNVSVIGGIIANGEIGTAGQVLASNSSGIYWTTVGGTGTVTEVSSANGIGGGPITTNGTLYIVANTGIIANVTGLYVNSAYIATLGSNNSTYLNGKTESDLNVNSATSAINANNSAYLNNKTESNLNVNSATSSLDANNSAYLGGNLPAYYTNASNITTGVLPWAQAPVGTVNTTGNFTLNGNVTLSGTFTNVTGTFQAGKVDHGNTVITGTANVTGNVLASGAFVKITGDLSLVNNGTQLSFATVNTFAYAIMKQQTDDNFVFYTTNTAYQPRVVFSIFANSTTSNLNISVPLSVPANTTLRGTFANVLGTFQAAKSDIGNTVITGTANVTGNVSITGGIVANGSIGTLGQVLTSNTTGIYWSTPTTGTVTSVSGANGITGGPITSTGTLYILANTGIVANVTGLYVNSAYIATIDSNNSYNLGGVNATGYALLSGASFTGNVTLGGTFVNVTGTFQGTKTNIGNTVITGTANVTGNVLATGTFVNVTGTFQGTKVDIGNTVITGTANVTGNVLITGSFVNVTGTFQSTNSTLNGTFANVLGTFQAGKVDHGNTVITGTANVTGNVLITGTFVNVTGTFQSTNTTLNGTFANVLGTFQAGKTNIGNTVITGTANVTGNVLASGAFVNVTGDLSLGTNAKKLSFATVNTSAGVYFTQQNDDNFVFYSTNTAYSPRAIWSIFANSTTSNLNIIVPLQPSAGIVANGSIGTAGQVLSSNGGGVYWSTPAALSVDQTATYTWTNTHTFTKAVNVTGTLQGTKTDIGNTVITGTANVTGNVLATGTFVNVTGDLSLGNNNKRLSFATVNTSAGAYFIQQSDDNFVFYTTNTAYSPRPVWSIFANSTTSNLNIIVALNAQGNSTLNGNFTNVTGTFQSTKTDIGNTVITGTANVTGNVLATGTFVNVTGDLQSATLRTGLSTITGNATLSGAFVNVTGTLQGTKTDIGNTVITGTANVTGNVLLSGTFANVTGTLQSASFRTGSATIGNTTISGAGNFEIATNATGDRNALIDFHSDDTYTDYSFRMLAGAGSNGIRQIVARGTLGLYLDTQDAAPIVFRTALVEAARVDAGGNVGIGNTSPNAKLQVTGTANISGDVVLGGNLNISTGVVTGNGFGLTSVNYLSQSTSAVDVQIFGNTSAGGDINTWKDGTRFYPTLPSNINTLDMNIYTEIFIRQVADAVPTANLSGAGGPGNPELSYRVIKVPTAGANTTLLTADWQTISVPGSASFFLNSIRDTTPTAGNTVGYLLQYQWRTIASSPDANAGTISVASTTTLNATGTGTYFTSKLNTRLQISPGALAFRNINTIYGNRLLGVDTAFGTAQTAVTYRVRDLYSNVSMLQTNVAFNFVGYK